MVQGRQRQEGELVGCCVGFWMKRFRLRVGAGRVEMDGLDCQRC